MPAKVDLMGKVFGDLAINKVVGKKNGRPLWQSKCKCGNLVYGNAGQYLAGRKKRCMDCGKKINTKHGCSHSKNQNVSREYRAWNGMRMRCNNPKNKAFPSYGGRGIKVDKRWDDFSTFLSDMGLCPPKCSLDRINVDGDYTPANCRWASATVQSNNRRINYNVEYLGEVRTVTEWARHFKVEPTYLFQALRRGYNFYEVVARIKNGAKYKKLHNRGESSKASRLTAEQVADLLVEYDSVPKNGSRKPKGLRKMLADKFGITPEYVSKIVAGKTYWTNVGQRPRRGGEADAGGMGEARE